MRQSQPEECEGYGMCAESNPAEDTDIYGCGEKTAWMKLYDEYADGKMSCEDFLQYKREYDDRLEELKQRLETAEMRKRQMKADEGEDAGRFEEVLKTTELTQEIMNAFIDHVDVFESNRIHIHWKFDPEG